MRFNGRVPNCARNLALIISKRIHDQAQEQKKEERNKPGPKAKAELPNEPFENELYHTPVHRQLGSGTDLGSDITIATFFPLKR